MHFSRVLMQWALLAACGALAAPRGALDMEPPMDLQAIEAPPPDQETFGYLLPRLAAKYRPSLQWGGVADPRLYILTEMENMQDSDDPLRSKRKQPSMSIVNPMDVLRQRLLLEIARKQMRENEIQAEKNRVFFKNVGKRNNNNMASYNNNLATDNNNLANGFNNNLANGFNNDFSPLPKRGLYSKMADVDSDRQAAVNAYFASGANNL